jgi:hypothetical protein
VSSPGRSSDTVLPPATAQPASTVSEDYTELPVVSARPGVRVRPAAVVVAAVSGIAILYGLLLHLWLLVHLPIWGDEAIVGVMARAIDAGHFTAFYPGQHYGGLEPYLVALALKVGGGGEPALNGAPAALAAVSAVLVSGLVAVVSRDRLLALAAGAAVWVWPYVVVWQSVREGGFREATLCCGLVALLCCVRACGAGAGPPTFAVLGVALGLGWWASPEIAYFVLPCFVLLVGWWRSAGGSKAVSGGEGAPSQWASLGMLVAGGILGSLPWWYANAHTGFASLKAGGLVNNGGMTYGAKLSTFFHGMLPLQLGLRSVLSGAWLGGPAVGKTLYAAMLVVGLAAIGRAAWLFVRAPARRLVPIAIAAGVVAYPFVYAAFPGTGYWIDGRYGIYFPALAVALLAAVIPSPLAAARGESSESRAGRHAGAPLLLGWRGLSRTLAALGVAVALCLTVAGAHAAGVPASPSFFTGWRAGDDAMLQVVDAMRAQHITHAYGDYWTAYDLDFLSGGQPLVSPNPLLDVVRAPALARDVAASNDPAWLFFPPGRTVEAEAEFGNPQAGPGPYTEQTFEARLRQIGVGYRVAKLGILDAVIPDRRVVAP